VRHFSKDYAVDPTRLAAAGASAGGSLALMLGAADDQRSSEAVDRVERESSKVQAVGCFFSPTDWVNYGEDGVSIVERLARAGSQDATFIFHNFDKTTGVYEAVTDKNRVTQLLREHSPAALASKDDAPTLIIHGDADRNVPMQQGRKMIDRLTEVGVPAKLVVREGKGHGWDGWSNDTALIADWFDDHLKSQKRP
jgi:dipeptidyl aminopeptidase/acylaminoacyl peptidase